MIVNLPIEQFQTLLAAITLFLLVCTVLLIIAETIKDWKKRPNVERRKYPRHRSIK